MFAKAKEFVVAHKKGIAIATGVAAVSVVAYKLYTSQSSSDSLNDMAEMALEAETPVKASSVYQS